MSLIYAAHQPDLLPYSGFFYKMAKADVLDLKIWDQYVNRGYQRRVLMRERWASLPLVPGSSHDSIFVKQVKPEAAAYLADVILHRYGRNSDGSRKAPFWDLDDRGERICDEIRSIKTDMLWEFNFRLILFIRDMLGIQTPLTVSRPIPDTMRGSEGLIYAMEAFPHPLTYLSGTGARVYMGDCAEFTAHNIPVIWSQHQHLSPDSILTTLFDHEVPMDVVLKEQPLQEEEEAS